jgi:hypothetical protein
MLAAQAHMRIAWLVVMLGGCSLYWGGGNGGSGDAGVCNYGASDPPSLQLRDPYTGQCESFGGGGCNPCNPCPAQGSIEPNWASCSSTCLGRAEANCYATAGCQAEMLDTSYWGCFPVEPQGELMAPNPDCTQLGADTCTQLDSCIAVYTSASATDKTATKFEKCVNEAAPPPPPPACSTLTTEQACLARTDCDAVYNGYDCTCDASGCTCKTETFASCETR